MTHNDVIELEAGIQIRRTLVTLEEFAEFIRHEKYFDLKFWWSVSEPTARGGDEILRRVGFTWDTRSSPVLGITWFEAAAFCASQEGRLPWYSEWKKLMQRGLPKRENGHPEWCGDWYHSAGIENPMQSSDSPSTRRVAGGVAERAVPDYSGAKIGFRVVYAFL